MFFKNSALEGYSKLIRRACVCTGEGIKCTHAKAGVLRQVIRQSASGLTSAKLSRLVNKQPVKSNNRQSNRHRGTIDKNASLSNTSLQRSQTKYNVEVAVLKDKANKMFTKCALIVVNKDSVESLDLSRLVECATNRPLDLQNFQYWLWHSAQLLISFMWKAWRRDHDIHCNLEGHNMDVQLHHHRPIDSWHEQQWSRYWQKSRVLSGIERECQQFMRLETTRTEGMSPNTARMLAEVDHQQMDQRQFNSYRGQMRVQWIIDMKGYGI